MNSGSTIPIPIECDFDFSGYARATLTFKCRCAEVDVEKDRWEFNESGFSVRLTQEEALSLLGPTEVQIRFRDAEGLIVDSSNIASVDFGRLLKQGVYEAVPNGAD